LLNPICKFKRLGPKATMIKHTDQDIEDNLDLLRMSLDLMNLPKETTWVKYEENQQIKYYALLKIKVKLHLMSRLDQSISRFLTQDSMLGKRFLYQI
jgi:hypothetical protein